MKLKMSLFALGIILIISIAVMRNEVVMKVKTDADIVPIHLILNYES